jgi:osmotically-inducible protein OsmY
MVRETAIEETNMPEEQTGRDRLRSRRTRLMTATVWLTFLVILAGGTAVRAASPPKSDGNIKNAVETKLLVEDAVSPHLIDVEVNNGIVTLSGTVAHLLEHDRAIEVTSTVRGVRSIVDRLTVRPVSRTDGEIRGDVAQALRLDPAADSYEIDVTVSDGVVTLTGTVESWAEKLLATDVVKGVKGIKDIENRLTYSYESDRPDYEIKADIERSLNADPYVDEAFIDVKVDNGVVRLRGTVGSLREKSYATSHARVAGIQRVLTEALEVESWARDEMQRATKVVPTTDAEAKRAINDAFVYDPRLYSFEVNVDVNDGVATLTGTVDNLEAKHAAERDARNTSGVWKVNNHIKVRPEDQTPDAKIAENVRQALLWDPIVDRFEIYVSVRNRQVFLSGVVDDDYEKTQAEEIAAGVKGVADVENRIIVRGDWPWKADAQIKEDIESEYAWNPFVDGGGITINVDDGHVELGGHVDTWHEYREAVENAFDGGARSVRAYLRVREYDKTFDNHFGESPTEEWPL